MTTKNLKILMAKPGLDGHDVGVKVLCHALCEKGYQVIYTGLRRSIEQITLQAKENSVDIIGLSILSGTHSILCKRMQEVMADMNLTTTWFVGGNIPDRDVEELTEMGAKKVFPTGTTISKVLDYINTFQTNK